MTLWQTIKNNPSALAWAIIIHVLAFAAIIVSFSASEPQMATVKPQKVIEAVAIDEKAINQELNKLKKAEQRKKREEKRLQDKARKAREQRRKEEKRLKALKKKQKELQRKAKLKQEKERKRIAALKEKRRQEELKQKLEEERLKELQRQRREKQAQLQREEKARQEKLAAQKKAAEEAKRARYVQGEVARYKGLIRNKITRNWIFPASYRKGMKCTVRVRIIPGGEVVSVQIIKSSGSAAFDRSVEQAVRKASPLPVPDAGSGLFDNFREVEFVFDPNEG